MEGKGASGKTYQLPLLVVEDDPGLNLLLKKRLSEEFRVEGVLSGEEAIELLKKNPDRLLILDYKLRRMTGDELIGQLARQGMAVPFICTTGHGDEATAVAMMKLGARDYIIKDAALLDRLVPVVKRVVEQLENEKRLAAAEQEQRRLAEQLQYAQKMEAVGTLAGGMARDFSDFLSVLRENLDLLERNPGDGAAARKGMARIREAMGRVTGLTRQLMLFAREEPLDMAALDINKTVNGILPLLKRLAGGDTDIRTYLEQNLPPVLADPLSLEQVLVNLAMNARNSMPPDGVLFIKTGYEDISEKRMHQIPNARPGIFISLAVTDMGEGMDEQTAARVFEPFFTVRPGRQDDGLGLSVVYGIIREHGGWVNVFSEPGHGTTFRVYLPALDTGKAV